MEAKRYFTRHYRMSCKAFTVMVRVDLGNWSIVEAAPIVKKFNGQPVMNLIFWMVKKGDFRMDELP